MFVKTSLYIFLRDHAHFADTCAAAERPPGTAAGMRVPSSFVCDFHGLFASVKHCLHVQMRTDRSRETYVHTCAHVDAMHCAILQSRNHCTGNLSLLHTLMAWRNLGALLALQHIARHCRVAQSEPS
jgi:hypothetical protein